MKFSLDNNGFLKRNWNEFNHILFNAQFVVYLLHFGRVNNAKFYSIMVVSMKYRQKLKNPEFS